MNMIAEKEFDYQAYVRENSPDTTKMTRGIENRQRRLEAAKTNTSVRIDAEVLQQFRQLVAPDEECDKLINQALREWLAAQNVKELVRAEIQNGIQQALAQVDWSSLKKQRRVSAVKKDLVK